MSLGDAVAREVAWLTTTGDGLPSLSVSNGGPWSVIRYWEPRTPGKRKTGIYVYRSDWRIVRFGNIRSMPTYDFELKLVWPLSSGQGSAESDLQAFENAVSLLVQRILGPVQDKTHGGRFLSVAEEPKWLSVHIDDPETTVAPVGGFMGKVMYSANDFEFAN